MSNKKIAILHYTAPPVIGGVEAVIKAHAQLFNQANYKVAVISGRGEQELLPPSVMLLKFPEIDTQHPSLTELNNQLEIGNLPKDFYHFSTNIENILKPILEDYDHVIIHNIFTKHFNLPLTAAVHNLIDQKVIRNPIAWCHDFTWTSPNSRKKVFSGYPWDLLRTYREDVQYVVVSKKRQKTLANLFNIHPGRIKVIYNGVDPVTLLGLSSEGEILIQKLGLLDTDINILMPVRVTQAKNIEYAFRVLVDLKCLGVKPKLVLTGPPDPHDVLNINYYNNLTSMRNNLGLQDEMHFVFDSGADPEQPYTINSRVVGDLFRISDLMFMPSHREGFGMPVLEAGMLGIPVMSTPVPASEEIAGNEAVLFDIKQSSQKTAVQIIQHLESNPLSRLRRKIRKDYTWQAIFHNQIIPLLEQNEN